MAATELYHFGVKGMHWGVRKSPLEGVSMKTYKQAGKDAAEHTKAKMYYGEGAGTRRKLIKAKVEQRAKLDPTYKKAFDHHVANTDMSKRAEQARSARARKDAMNYAGKTQRGIKRMVAPAAGTMAALGIATYITSPGVRKTVNDVAKTGFQAAKAVGHAAWTRTSKSAAFRKVWSQTFVDLP